MLEEKGVGPLAASREENSSRLHTRFLLGLGLGRMVEEDVVQDPVKPFLVLLSEQKVRLNFVLLPGPRQNRLFGLAL